MDQVYPYCIVLFTKESAVEIVPSIWVKGSEPENFQCYWPKFNTRYHVKKKSIPDKEKWTKYEVRIMGKAENYPDACVKLRTAEETSNIENIESDEDTPPRKRKTRLPTRYLSSESENEEQSEFLNMPEAVHSTPTKHKVKRKRRGDFHERLIHQTSSVSLPDPPAYSTTSSAQRSDYPTTSSAHRSDHQTTIENSLERRLMIKLDSILENQREQFNFMKQQVYFGTSTPPACDYGNLLSRPMQTENEIKLLSEKLENEPEYTKKMVSYLSTVGGRSTSECVRNILGKIATPSSHEL